MNTDQSKTLAHVEGFSDYIDHVLRIDEEAHCSSLPANEEPLERDYEPEQAYGTAHDFMRHRQFGGNRNDY